MGTSGIEVITHLSVIIGLGKVSLSSSPFTYVPLPSLLSKPTGKHLKFLMSSCKRYITVLHMLELLIYLSDI